MRTPKENLVDVAVMAALPRPLTYRVPERLAVRTGQRVFVPLGKRRAQGIVLEPAAQMAAGVKARDIIEVIDPEPLLSPELLTLGLWIAEYYVAPVGEVFRAMLPLLKETRRTERLEITPAGRTRLETLLSPVKANAGQSDHGAAPAPTPELQLLQALARRALELDSARRRFGADPVERVQREGWAEPHRLEEKQARRKLLSVRLAGPLPEHLPKLSPVARRILDALAGGPGERAGESEGSEASGAQDHRPLLKQARGSLAHLKRLEEAGLVEVEDRSAFGAPAAAMDDSTSRLELDTDPPFQLTPAQSKALDDLSGRLQTN